jgi:hypothetical protein
MKLLPSIVAIAFVASASCSAPPPVDPTLLLDLSFDGDWNNRGAAQLSVEGSEQGLSFEPGVRDEALCFDGSGASLTIAGFGKLPLLDELTFEMQLYVEDWRNPYRLSAPIETVVSHSDVLTFAVSSSDSVLDVALTTSGSPEGHTLVGQRLKRNAWHHVALVYRGKQREAKLYIDGDPVATLEIEGTLLLQRELPLVIGTWFKENQAFCGRIDDLRLWNKALSREILATRSTTPALAGG